MKKKQIRKPILFFLFVILFCSIYSLYHIKESFDEYKITTTLNDIIYNSLGPIKSNLIHIKNNI